MEYINVTNKGKETGFEEDIKNVSKLTCEMLKVNNPVIDIVITNNEEIHKLNKEYRDVDRETDVLSFTLEEVSDIIYEDFRLLGDIYISIDKAKEQAKEYNHSLKRELCYLTVHGTLHLLGYDHMTEEERIEMRKLEESVLDGYDVKR